MLRCDPFRVLAAAGANSQLREWLYRFCADLPADLLSSLDDRTGSAVIVLKISNSSEIVASKVGRFLERLTPDSLDEAKVEEEVIKKLVENLRAEGIEGSVASVKGLDLNQEGILMKGDIHLRRYAEI